MSTKQAIVARLAAVYGFNKEEAMGHLSTRKNKLMEKPSVIIPFIRPIEGWCDGVKLNHNLFTQCTNKPMSTGALCKTCQKQADEAGKPACGLASERATEGAEWRDPKGRQPAQFGKVMEKLKVEQEAVEGELKRLFGEDDYSMYFEVQKAVRGRPKKAEGEKKQRGRPKKSKEVVSTDGEDLIATLIAQAQAETSDADEESAGERPVTEAPALSTPKAEKKATKKAEKEAAKQTKLAEKEAAKQTKLAEKEAAKQAKKAEKEAVKKAEKEAAKAAKKAEKEVVKLAEKEAAKAAKKAEKEAVKKAEKEAAKQTKLAEKEAAKQAKLAEKEAAKLAKKAEKEAAKKEAAKPAEEVVETEELTADSPVEDVNVEVRVLNGKEYLVAADNSVYAMESQEYMGVWDDVKEEIVC